MLAKIIDNILINRKNDHVKSGYMFKPSIIHKCPREIYYLIKNPELEVVFEPKTLRIFDNGNDMHKRYQKYLIDILVGEKEGEEYVEPVFTDDKLNVYGRIDGIIKVGEEVLILELKSINSYGFKQLKEAKDDHILQVHLYFYLTKYDKAIILYENKDNQEIKEFLIKKDDKIIENLINKIEYIKQCVENDILPDRCCVTINDSKAKWCNFKEICFNQNLKLDEEKLFNRDVKKVDYKGVF